MKRLLMLAMLMPVIAHAAPFIVTDPAKNADGSPVDPAKTQCVVKEGEVEAVSALVNLGCHVDVGNVSVGTHNVQIYYRFTDALWGASDSPKSDFVFTKPTANVLAPTNPRLELK